MVNTVEGQSQAVRADFVERWGKVIAAEGWPESCGRILALLMLSSEPVAFSDIAKTLNLSPASVSNNTRLLQSVGQIERVPGTGRRKVFRALSSPYLGYMRAQLERNRIGRTLLIETLGAADHAGLGAPACERLAEMLWFFDFSIRRSEAFLAHFEEHGKAGLATLT